VGFLFNVSGRKSLPQGYKQMLIAGIQRGKKVLEICKFIQPFGCCFYPFEINKGFSLDRSRIPEKMFNWSILSQF